MADRCNTIRLYSFQTDVVYQVLKRDGVCYSKEEYVRKKYKESAKVFINAYGWFVKEAQHIVPKPEGAEYPYWAFTDLYNVDQTGDGGKTGCDGTNENAGSDEMGWFNE